MGESPPSLRTEREDNQQSIGATGRIINDGKPTRREKQRDSLPTRTEYESR